MSNSPRKKAQPVGPDKVFATVSASSGSVIVYASNAQLAAPQGRGERIVEYVRADLTLPAKIVEAVRRVEREINSGPGWLDRTRSAQLDLEAMLIHARPRRASLGHEE